MNAAQLRKVQAFDIIRADVRGHVFHANVDGAETRFGVDGLLITPIERGVSFRFVEGTDVEEFFARGGRVKPARKAKP